MTQNDDSRQDEPDPLDPDLEPSPERDEGLADVDGEAVVVPGQRPGPTEPLPISTEM